MSQSHAELANRASATHVRRFGTVAVVLLILVLGFAMINRKSMLVGWNKPIKYDDLAFTVLDVTKTPGAPGRTTFAVTVRVDCQALRVTNVYDVSHIHCLDVDERDYAPISIDGRPAWDPIVRVARLPPGASRTVKLSYDVPSTIVKPRVGIKGGNALTAGIDWLFLGWKRIELEDIPARQLASEPSIKP